MAMAKAWQGDVEVIETEYCVSKDAWFEYIHIGFATFCILSLRIVHLLVHTERMFTT